MEAWDQSELRRGTRVDAGAIEPLECGLRLVLPPFDEGEGWSGRRREPGNAPAAGACARARRRGSGGRGRRGTHSGRWGRGRRGRWRPIRASAGAGSRCRGPPRGAGRDGDTRRCDEGRRWRADCRLRWRVGGRRGEGRYRPGPGCGRARGGPRRGRGASVPERGCPVSAGRRHRCGRRRESRDPSAAVGWRPAEALPNAPPVQGHPGTR
jgi:hypothetical protein